MIRVLPLHTAFVAACTLAGALSAVSQSGTPAVVAPMANPDPRLATIHAQINQINVPSQVAISPDGATIAYTLGESELSTLHLISATSPDPAKERLVAPNGATSCSTSSPVWAPDSQWLAYTSSCTTTKDQPGKDQIFLWSRATGESRQLTHVVGLFHQPAFSPDGKTLAFLFVEHASRSAGALAAMKPWSGVIGEDGVEIQRVYAVDIKSGQGSWLTPADLHVYEFGWAPDSQKLTFVGARPPGENNWWGAKLYTLAPGSTAGSTPTIVFDPNTTSTALHGLQIAVPRFSPDGRHIAFIGGLMSDQGSTGGDIWVVDASGQQPPTDVTPNIDGSPTYLSWTGSDTIGFVEDRRGHNLLVDYTVSTSSQDSVQDLGETAVYGGPIKNAIGVSQRGVLAFIKSGHNAAPEVWAGPFNAQKQITHLNDSAKPGTHTESVEWENEGFHVQGWLTYPVGYDSTKKYPLLVSVHGGPSASAGAQFESSAWPRLGYFVFYPNPRGSFGQGEKFTAANVKDFGYGDLRDILAGMDLIETKVSIDKSREGLMGWSYGGFMTMFGVTQTTRFRAAVAGAGISNWKSYYGENSIDQWMVPFFGATVYDDPAAYAKSSAIEFIKNIKTPTLVVVGDRDGECPAPQSFEFWHALRAEGTKTQLVVYPNEGHHFVDASHIRDLEAREVAWFAENMPAK